MSSARHSWSVVTTYQTKAYAVAFICRSCCKLHRGDVSKPTASLRGLCRGFLLAVRMPAEK